MPDATPQIAPIHDLMHLFEPTFPEVGTEKEIASRNRRYMGMSRYCTAILVDSHLGKEHVLQHYPAQPEQIHVVPYAAPPQLLTCRPERPDGDFPGHFIFYPAQFWHHKNHIRLLNAIHAARTTCPDIHCIFSGSTIHQGYPHFAEEVKKLKIQQAVTVLGYVSTPEMAWLYRNARGLVMPTLFGPTNIPPLEAMATGCPAAVSDIYAMREQCKDAVLYFDPKDESSMASAITALWLDKDLRMRLKEKGLAHHRQWTAQDMQKTFASIVKEQLQI
jgi:glycosyltransferase involved in cell wall biosynthesis